MVLRAQYKNLQNKRRSISLDLDEKNKTEEKIQSLANLIANIIGEDFKDDGKVTTVITQEIIKFDIGEEE